MPVNLLLCEGGPNSPDVRLLSKLLAGQCEVRPMGGKQGMGDRIKARRENLGNTVYGMLDGDFLTDWEMPRGKPHSWTINENNRTIHLGWRWERKEVENYLIDPEVVHRALGSASPPEDEYKDALDQTRDEIAIYQAARTALSACRRRFSPLPSAFGPKRGREKHPFPDKLDEPACRAGIDQTVQEYADAHVTTPEHAIGRFSAYTQEFQSGADRRNYFLYAFAGKDLLWAMNERLQQWGFAGAWAFRERVLKGVLRASKDIANWLPEWKALLEEIKTA